MQLELTLSPDDGARVPRLAVLAPLRTGRARSRQVRIIWHDGPDRTLARQGLALAEQRPVWRLERLDEQLPGAPAHEVAAGRDAATLGQTLPDPLIPLAAFEGRSRNLVLATGQGNVTMTLVDGVVRTIAGEHRTSRLHLDGPAQAVQHLANLLADNLSVGVACSSLAADALSTAAGVAPAEREGPPELPPGLTVAEAFAHVTGHLAGVILHFAPAAAAGRDGPEPVHQMRVAVRRLRSANKVFRRALHCPSVDAVDLGLKALAARLAPTRDWDVFATETVVGVTEAFPEEKRLQRLMAAVERRRRACHEDLRAFLTSSEFRRLGIAMACLAGSQDWHAELGETEQAELVVPLDEFAARVLDRRLKRLAQGDSDIAELDPATLHTIRLRAKRLRYAAEIFALLYPAKLASRYLRRLSKLQDRLGTLNDAAVAAGLLAELTGNNGGHAFATGLVLGFVGANGVRARRRIERAWQRFSRVSAFWE